MASILLRSLIWPHSLFLHSRNGLMLMERNIKSFRDRRDAGRQLGAALMYLKQDRPIVLALPRGGVPVAFEVAKALRAPLDVLLVRKIGAPMAPELGIGAVVDGNPPLRVLNLPLIQQLQTSPDYIEAEAERQIEVIAHRRQLYCGGRARIDIRNRTTIVVDDGIATGGTMKAALQALAQQQPKRLLFAIPVAPRDSLASLHESADDSVCLVTPERFRAVSLYYDDFDQTTDEEVIALLDMPTFETARLSTEQENIMQAISEIMTRDVTVISPQDTIQRAAQMMNEWDVGALPVCDGTNLIGMITDRDITIRAVAGGQPPDQVRVADVMTDDVLWCYEDQTVGEVLQQMGDEQIRRIPVLDRDKNLIGMVSLGDIAARHSADTDDTLEDISNPSEPNRPSSDEVRLHRPQSDQAGGRF